MATDIAFALGILALLGSRVPPGLRMALLALAVIDDLGAIIVIALFYSTGVSVPLLGLAALGVLSILGLQRLGVRSKLVYLLPAVVIWVGVYGANIHPTIAGVIVGLLTPVTKAADELAAPADSLIHALHPVVAFAIMPIFALANAGVSLASGARTAAGDNVVLAVVVGLCVGKPIGVVSACWLTLRLGLAKLPRGIGFRHVVLLGLVAGVGFTMALFIAKLAFADESLLEAAKLGVLLASATAAVLSLVLGRFLLGERPRERPGS
jgi:NhaA family Na+:H+ antiporter